MPPHSVPLLTEMFGLAVLVSSCFVAAISRTRFGRADQSRATTPTTCGPAIEVPLKVMYELSLVLIDERVFVPGATMSGLRRPEPSTVTGPRLLKPARVIVAVVSAPVEKEAA